MVESFSNLEESQNSCLPAQCKSILPVFPISLLEPVKTSRIPNWHQNPPPQIIIAEEEEWEVSQIFEPNPREQNYGVWWNGEVSVKTQKDPLGNQLKTSRIVLNQDPILPELDYLWFLVGRGIPKGRSHSCYAPLEVFYHSCC
ncbi:hypothetical protein O181_012765 [Austropuccinia psidii MF-1]|uniref:Uncharacterized protein n=1 Tax=Austropuccinia psidii MF-1 TaxID=1389203 RepID=A0A9Q3GN94_9BASI|nr:hypothetical protein [Austropuccinia psidii MF-1]